MSARSLTKQSRSTVLHVHVNQHLYHSVFTHIVIFTCCFGQFQPHTVIILLPLLTRNKNNSCNQYFFFSCVICSVLKVSPYSFKDNVIFIFIIFKCCGNFFSGHFLNGWVSWPQIPKEKMLALQLTVCIFFSTRGH